MYIFTYRHTKFVWVGVCIYLRICTQNVHVYVDIFTYMHTGPHESVYVIPYIHTAFTYVFVYLREIIDGIWRELFIYASCGGGFI